MKATVLNTSDFEKYGFSKKPKFMQLEECLNGYKEVTAIFIGLNGRNFFSVTNKIK